VVTVAAIYARVSSDKQREEKTIASQTAALIDFARNRGHHVPQEWIFEDEGYSGATLVRPGLERVRDLAAEGQIHAVLVYAPDRLSRKYAYQVLLIEEFARQGVETIFLKAPQTATPEDQLLVQFQGMIAEYERAQILERSRRGKRHRARQGEVSVLSGAPYGYRYVRKSDDRAAYYEIIEAEADVVRMAYDRYVSQGLSIGAITRLLNEQGVPTRYCAVEPRRIDLSQQQAERERVAEGKLADLARGDLGVQDVAVPDRALKAAVCCALAGHRRMPLGRRPFPTIAAGIRWLQARRRFWTQDRSLSGFYNFSASELR